MAHRVAESHSASAAEVRRRIDTNLHDPVAFRTSLLDVPPHQRDEWLDLVLGIDDVANDGPHLPSGCVPYIPCPVDALLEIVDAAPLAPTDTFVDLGSGVGRAMAFVHLMTGASAIGVDVQPELVSAARAIPVRLHTDRISFVEGDAARVIGDIAIGSVYFLYCPFSGDRLERVLAVLEQIATTKPLTIATVDLPLPPCTWLQRVSIAVRVRGVALFRSLPRPS